MISWCLRKRSSLPPLLTMIQSLQVLPFICRWTCVPFSTQLFTPHHDELSFKMCSKLQLCKMYYYVMVLRVFLSNLLLRKVMYFCQIISTSSKVDLWQEWPQASAFASILLCSLQDSGEPAAKHATLSATLSPTTCHITIFCGELKATHVNHRGYYTITLSAADADGFVSTSDTFVYGGEIAAGEKVSCFPLGMSL